MAFSFSSVLQLSKSTNNKGRMILVVFKGLSFYRCRSSSKYPLKAKVTVGLKQVLNNKIGLVVVELRYNRFFYGLIRIARTCTIFLEYCHVERSRDIYFFDFSILTSFLISK